MKYQLYEIQTMTIANRELQYLFEIEEIHWYDKDYEPYTEPSQFDSPEECQEKIKDYLERERDEKWHELNIDSISHYTCLPIIQ